MRIFDATATLSLDELMNILAEQQPAIHIERIEKIGEGWDNYVYQVNDNMIFRAPRREIAIKLLETEYHVLPVIADKLPLLISKPFCRLESSDVFPQAILGYNKINGDDGCDVDLSLAEYKATARELGAFLKTLHGLDAKQLGLKKYLPSSFRIDKQFLFDRVYPRWEELLQDKKYEAFQSIVDKIIGAVKSTEFDFSEHCLIHGDLHNRHVIFDNNQLCGVIDWGDLGWSHFIVDLMIIYQFFPEQSHADFYAVYGEISDDLKLYAKYLALMMAITFLWYGKDIKDQKLIDSAEKTLLNLQSIG